MAETDALRTIVLKYFSPENIDSVNIFNNRAIVTLINTPEDTSKTEALKAEILQLEGVSKATIVYTTVKEDENDHHWKIRGVKKIVAVASGKGGVGKSTTAVNIALALKRLGQRVALFDADIYGPSVPTMLNYEGAALISKDGTTFEPFEVMGLQTMSIGTLVDRNTPVIWRGPKACGALQQLLSDVNWADVDVMVIDMPPGTGDIQITLSQQVRISGAVIVSTPQDIALIDAIKGVNMFKAVNVPILGIVENMSYHICEKCGHKEYIFGEHGAEDTAGKIGVDFLGGVPLNIKIRSHADAGTPIVESEPDGKFAKAYLNIAANIIKKLNYQA